MRVFMISRFIIAVLVVVAPVGSATAGGTTEPFKAQSARMAERIKESTEFHRGGCYVDAIFTPVVVRTQESLLKPGDRVESVNGKAVGPGDSIYRAIGALPATEGVTLGIRRGTTRLAEKLACLNESSVSAQLYSAYEAAGRGNFSDCADKMGEYMGAHAISAQEYELYYGCVEEGGIIVGDAIVGPLLTYWNLRLEELKYHPEQIDAVRSEYVADEQILLTNGKTLALDELRRQWALATGEASNPLPPTAAVPIAPLHSVSKLVLQGFGRSVRGSCEDDHSIRTVSGDGEIVILDDGSVWEVDFSDRVESALWLSSENIIACDGKLINTDQNETAEAERKN
jgi:hypothetical protein